MQTESEKQNRKDSKRRHNSWYQRYFEMAVLLKSNGCKNIPIILRHVHSMIDSNHGYGYRHISYSASESLDLVLKDIGVE